jgi:hypothetical protein
MFAVVETMLQSGPEKIGSLKHAETLRPLGSHERQAVIYVCYDTRATVLPLSLRRSR